MIAPAEPLKAPFPYFGGKSRAASLVWQRFGDVPNYVEPFAGSLAVLLGRPDWPRDGNRIETVNDLDCFLANFWRALQSDPDAVARHCDWPVNEADLHARHLWLVNVGKDHVQRLRTEPDYHDARIAGWWVWGICQWIGSGWCAGVSSWSGRPFADGELAHPKRPHLGDAGVGVHRPSQQLPHLGNAGMGVHRPSQQLPHLGNAHGQGITPIIERREIYGYFDALADRIRRVRVCCGDWRRVLGETPTTKRGTTAVFLDPPYTAEAKRATGLYAQDDYSVGHAVRDWAVEHGDDKKMRIALCGYEGEYELPDSWACVAWKARGGYGSQAAGTGLANAHRERIWFSPHCLKVAKRGTRELFAEVV